MVTNNFEKFRLLLWKNWIIQWNHKCQVLFELLLPVLFALLLVMVRLLVEPVPSGVVIYNIPLPIDNLLFLKYFMSLKPFLPLKYHLAYSPNTSQIFENIVKDAATQLQLTYSGYVNSRVLEKVLTEETYLAGVEFDDSMARITTYPEHLRYKLRFPPQLRTDFSPFVITWMTHMRFWPLDGLGPRNKKYVDGGLPVGYLGEGFLPVQYAISTAFIKQAATIEGTLPRVFLQRYPYPEYIDDPLISGLAGMMGLVILLSYIYPCMCTVKYITTEKEKQLKEVMKIMGLPNGLHWLAWFAQAFSMMGISAFVITAILTIKWKDDVAVLTYSSVTPIFFFLLVYTTASITLCFMLATFFSRASNAAAATGMIWFIMYLPYTWVDKNYDKLPARTKIGWCLFSNTAMGLGVRLIAADEAYGEGLQWSNMFTHVNVDDELSVGHVIALMLVLSAVHLVICLYIEQIYPGEFGVPKKWNFPFTKQFWVDERKYLHINLADTSHEVKRANTDAFEKEPTGATVGLQVKNLTKKFGNMTAVNNVSLNMYKDEITVLLGRNGAGKTSTISMLTGMFPPTSGTAIVNGFDIRTHIDDARNSLGICPQHNILFDDLTVKHHLIFYSRMKGLKGADLEAEVNKYIKKIDLEKKANVASSKLSGGMKRKLSVCSAFCGGTKVVLCDEPSSGMDPAARRQLWNLLQEEKEGRTVLLTTHFMDEADVLGDRIAIMADGELKCVGTSFFLKKKYGSGYHLICVKKDDCDSTKVTNLLSKYIPEIQPESEIGTELSYRLPDGYSPKFETMFEDLESNSDNLKLNGYGVSITSLEEVFMKVGGLEAKSGKEQIISAGTFGSKDGEPMSSGNMFSKNQYLLHGIQLMVNQWRSMILKKYLQTIRHKWMLAIQNILPIIFIALSFLFGADFYKQLKPLVLDLFQFPTTVTVLETNSNVKDGSLEWIIARNYKDFGNSLGSDHKLVETGNQSFISYMLELGKTIQPLINTRYIAAATVNKGYIIAWLNNKPLHSAPVTLNLIFNAVARTLIGPKASISVTNAPLPYSKTEVFQMLESGQNVGTRMAMNLCFCMCFVSGSYVILLIKERQSRAKLLQFISGVKITIFWLSHFVWDMLTLTITTAIIILTFACFQEEGYKTFNELSANMAMIMLFNLTVLPFIYVLERLFSEPAMGFARLAVFNIFCGNAIFITVTVMRIPVFNTKDEAEFVEKIFVVSPHFALVQSLNKLYKNGEIRKFCDSLADKLSSSRLCALYPDCCNRVSYFAWEAPGVLREAIYLSITCFVCFVILFVRECRVMDGLWDIIRQKAISPPVLPEDGYIDEDVKQEKEKIQNMQPSEIAEKTLVLDRVTKFYGRYVAVNQISLVVSHSECFGLLGVNGAGKTSTFKMMTGDEKISSGDAYFKGLSLKIHMHQVYQDIGYCPQFDALFEEFTGRELLKMYGLLRGVPAGKIPGISMDLARDFSFMKHYNKKVHAYSGGNKRKLSSAIAVLGTPSLIYLDEPSAGMDPVARRQLWNMVCSIRNEGKAIILTSHSMDECEALCTRLAIMVNGEFKCIGATQHLKNKFAKGLTLKLKMKKDTNLTRSFIENTTDDKKLMSVKRMEEDVNIVKAFIKEEFPKAYLQEQYEGILTFHIPVTSILWSKIFGLMERNKAELNIEDYSISQTTFEEVFLQFAIYQREDLREIKNMAILLLFSVSVLSFFFFVNKLFANGEVNKLCDSLMEKFPPQPLCFAYAKCCKSMTTSQIAETNVVLDNVSKFYKRFVAVNQTTLAVRHSECFGLLGVNGSGKTTTFKMMTGDEKISSGEAYVKGFTLKRDMNQVYQEIGYCPQFDALFDDFTGREMLRMYSLPRGIPESRISHISTDLARGFGFMKHFNKQVHAYSGGNKRKLSTAIAVLGGPSVIPLVSFFTI